MDDLARFCCQNPACSLYGRRTAGNLIRQVWTFMLTGLVPMHRLDRFDRRQQHPQPAHPRLSGQSALWRSEHIDPTKKIIASA